MAAPFGNKNAEKWDLEEALSLFNDLRDLTETETYDFIGEAAKDLGVYRSLLDYLAGKFKEVQPIYNQAKGNCEVNCFRNSKNGKIKEATAIVNLKSNYGWTDRQEMKHSGASVTIVVDKEAKNGIDDLTGNG